MTGRTFSVLGAREVYRDSFTDDEDYSEPDLGLTEDQVIAICDSDPPKRIEDPDPNLFTDLESHLLGRALFNMWQCGILDAKYRQGETTWWLTEFGREVADRNLIGTYAAATDPDRRSLNGGLPLAVRDLVAGTTGVR